MRREDEDTDMASEARIESQIAVSLEQRVATIETERKHLATKDDLSQMETRLIKSMIATQLAMIAVLLNTQLALAALVVHLAR